MKAPLFVLKVPLILALFSLRATATDSTAFVIGKGNTKCEDELPTLSVAAENTVRSRADWDSYVEKYPLFVAAAADSKCSGCCDSEPLLRDLEVFVKDKAVFSYAEKNKKQKKIVRKEVKIVRVDLADKALVEKLAELGVWFPMGTTVLIVKEGRAFEYKGMWSDVNMLLHHLQRVANPVVTLTSEEKVLSFLDTSQASIWEDDYSGAALSPKGVIFDPERKMDKLAKLEGFNTRVVAFFFDKSEYAEEIKFLTSSALFLSSRYGLRIGLVTDQRLITKLKKSHPDLFFDVGMSVMVLRRYDGALMKLNVADA